MTSQYPAAPPPGYSDAPGAPLLVPDDSNFNNNNNNINNNTNINQQGPRTENDHVPDDFKYGNFVSECTLSIRQAFVRKVYTILTLQLLVTFCISSLFMLNDSLSHWALLNTWAFYTSMAGSMVFLFLAFIKSRSYPINLLFLTFFTLFESYLVGFVSATYDTRIVLEAFLITLIVFVGLTIFAMQSTYDFTQWQGFALGGLFFLMGTSIVAIFIPFSSTMELVYSCFGAFLFSVYILIDTQMIMSHFHPEDEVSAAISLYIDIINLFLYILRILQETQDN